MIPIVIGRRIVFRLALPFALLAAAGWTGNAIAQDEVEFGCAPITGSTALENGSIELEFTPVPGAAAHGVYRKGSGDAFFTLVGTTGGADTSFLDATTAPSSVFEYFIVGTNDPDALGAASNGPEEFGLEDCITRAASIPFFPTAIAGALGLAGAAGTYMALRRR